MSQSTSGPVPDHGPIGAHFRATGAITESQLEAALTHKNEHGLKLGQALVALGFIPESALVDALRNQGKIHSIHLTPGIVDSQVARRLGERSSRRLHAVAVNRIADHTTVAMGDPSDVYAIDELARALDSRILPVFAERARIDEAIRHVFVAEELRSASEETGRVVDKLAEIARLEESSARISASPRATGLGSGADVTLFESTEDDEEGGGEDLDQPVINLVRSVFEDAFVQGASDIHLEPRRSDLLVRFRIDGVLFDRTTVPKSWARPVLARIKVLADLDIAQKRLPQDGRIQFRYRNHRVDMRVATTPCLQGEGAVLRVLDGGRELHSIEKLDFDAPQIELLEQMIQCRDGFILATGPTGSGKTTTLYALLQRLNGADRKIITLEDPVENEMSGITQISCHHKIGLDFAKGLRSVLRQDPDVLLVGEIRDHETAEIAVQAAMTGHIVLSTLHTVGAPESIMRLADMGVEPYLIADTLRGVVAQRLVRRICQACRHPVGPDPVTLRRLGLPDDDAVQFYAGDGCPVCHGTGFRGRIGLYEVLRITPRLRNLIARGNTTEELIEAAKEEGTVSLREDGLRKARAGLTTLQDVLAASSRA